MDLHVGGLRAYCVGAVTEEIVLQMMHLHLHHHLLDSLYRAAQRCLGAVGFDQPVRLEVRIGVALLL